MTRHAPVMYLQHMREYALKAVEFAEGRTREDVDEDEQFAFALRYAVGTVGEAASKVPRAVQRDHPQIPWQAIIGMRHRLVHDYERVDYEVVWDAVQNDLPVLLQLLEVAIARLERSAEDSAEERSR